MTKTTNIINTMWEELTAYQPIADKNGHGDSWRLMCEERTEAAAHRAVSAAPEMEDAADAAAWAGMSILAAAHQKWSSAKDYAKASIASIRKAKEAAR